MQYSSLIGAIANTAVGTIMLIATFTKYMRPNVFTRQIREYQILPIPLFIEDSDKTEGEYWTEYERKNVAQIITCFI